MSTPTDRQRRRREPTPEEWRCSAVASMSGEPCRHTAFVEFGGRRYCYQHDPGRYTAPPNTDRWRRFTSWSGKVYHPQRSIENQPWTVWKRGLVVGFCYTRGHADAVLGYRRKER